MKLVLAVSFLTLTACNSTSLIVRTPIEHACASSGLHRCDKMTDGAMDYLNGNRGDGEVEMFEAAAANEPGKIKAFAMALEPLVETIPGMPQELKDVVKLLSDGDLTKKTPGKTSFNAPIVPNFNFNNKPSHNASPPTTVADYSSVPYTFTLASNVYVVDGSSKLCEWSITQNHMLCEEQPALHGLGKQSFTITDVYYPGGCRDDLFLTIDNHPWYIYMPHSEQANHITSLDVVIPIGSNLKYGTLWQDTGPKQSGLACSLTVSGIFSAPK